MVTSTRALTALLWCLVLFAAAVAVAVLLRGAPAPVPEVPPTDEPRPLLIDWTAESQLTQMKPIEMAETRPDTLAGGAAFCDFDGDGDQDLVLASRTLTLFAGDGRGHFEDRTVGSGLEAPIRALGVLATDLDGDGRIDLFVTAAGANRLYRGDGTGHFVDVTESAGVGGDPSAWHTGATVLDHDGDGDLDLFVVAVTTWTGELPPAPALTSAGTSEDPWAVTGAHPTLFANQGDGVFRDVSAAAGVRVLEPQSLAPACRAFGTTAGDLDGDGRTDLLVACFGGEDRVFRNRGDGTFEETAGLAGLGFDSAGNATETTAVVLGHVSSSARPFVATARSDTPALGLFVPEGQGLLYRETGASWQTTAEPTPLLGAVFADLDQDGRLDLVTAGGRGMGRGAQGGPGAFLIYLDVARSSAPADLGHLPVPPEARGVACADVDGDGSLDVLISAARGRPVLLRTQPPRDHHWLRVVLRGRPPNTSALGARLELEAGGQIQRRELQIQGSPAHSELVATFGLGKAARVDRLTVTWPAGKHETLRDLPADQVQIVEER